VENRKVDNAIILAAGFGSRFIPVTFEIPKGLVPVKGKPLLERQIEQLREAGIRDIIIVTGYRREAFSYLKEKYGVRLVYNKDYAVKNNLSSLYYARRFLKNSYIIYSDNWLEKNLFHDAEERSWYSCVYKEGETDEWCVSSDENDKITGVSIGGRDSWVMYGPVFLGEEFSVPFKEKIFEYFHKPGHENDMWEDVYIAELSKFDLYLNKRETDEVLEFETLDELRAFDPDYGYHTGNQCLETITQVFGVEEKQIRNIEKLKAGMTNNSFSFTLEGGKADGRAFVFRRPGEGSNILINRKQEKRVYDAIKNLGVCDDVVFFDENVGVKISAFYPGIRNTNPRDEKDVDDSLSILRRVHAGNISVNHRFDIGGEIRRYLNLMLGKDNAKYVFNTRMYFKMARILNMIKHAVVPVTLCHIDCNPDNFIRLNDGAIKLIDWEYAGMCDPIIDISMYSIYSYYTKKEADWLLEKYLERKPREDEYMRLYAYMALGGFLWMLWTEYKQFFGIEFGEYGLKMRQYAEVYYDYTLAIRRKNEERAH
jgi:CTP:phosphocholine cytidylyltransferase-like protein/thiamine kinase-like enzyme